MESNYPSGASLDLERKFFDAEISFKQIFFCLANISIFPFERLDQWAKII